MKLTALTVDKFLDELASPSPAPGGGSVAALSAAVGSALTSMVCNLTIGKKRYAEVESELKGILVKSEELRGKFTKLVDDDTYAFNKVMEAYGLPKETENQKALRTAAIQEATKEAALVPLGVMKHVVDAFALAGVVARKGNANSVSDAGVSAHLLLAAAEAAALNVRINLQAITDSEFVGWRAEEVGSLLKTSKAAAFEILSVIGEKIGGNS